MFVRSFVNTWRQFSKFPSCSRHTTSCFELHNDRTMCAIFSPSKRCKYMQHKGVKGIRSKKSSTEARLIPEADQEDSESEAGTERLNLDDREYEEVASHAMHLTRDFSIAQNVLIIQPYVKWGAKRNTTTTPDDQLKEAEALIHSLPNWSVALALKVPLESLERKTLFGSGKMEELKGIVAQLRQRTTSNQAPLTCLFVSRGALSFAQKRNLEGEFHLPIMDRYSVVIQILRLHASSAEARIQVAMAEIPYIWAQAKDANQSMSRKAGFSLTDTQREALKSRERKLKTELERIRSHRQLLRNKRQQKQYPIVAVVGYTNAGKTSLIKALTQEHTMQPRDQLFATLDVTAHGGVLPCNLEVIYMDTVGFMADLPTGLIECFIATLEDAMQADVIVHVQDISHDNVRAQRQHVETTLQLLVQSVSSTPDERPQLPPIINVGNKIDLVPQKPSNLPTQEDFHLVSARQQTGLEALVQRIENAILVATKRRKLSIRVSSGGSEMAWLYKNAAVVNVRADAKDSELLLMDVVITNTAIDQFRRYICGKN